MIYVDIYGAMVYLPDTVEYNQIDGWDLPKEQQMWRRKELPSFFDYVQFDKDGNALLTVEQKIYTILS